MKDSCEHPQTNTTQRQDNTVTTNNNDAFKTVVIFGIGIAIGLAIASIAGCGTKRQGEW
jgi:hypothetical protein